MPMMKTRLYYITIRWSPNYVFTIPKPTLKQHSWLSTIVFLLSGETFIRFWLSPWTNWEANVEPALHTGIILRHGLPCVRYLGYTSVFTFTNMVINYTKTNLTGLTDSSLQIVVRVLWECFHWLNSMRFPCAWQSNIQHPHHVEILIVMMIIWCT